MRGHPFDWAVLWCTAAAISAVPCRVSAEKPVGRALRAASVSVPAGSYTPLYALNGKRIRVAAFSMDQYPVTREAFASFILTHREWARSAVRVSGYLADWPADKQHSNATDAVRPVTSVTRGAAQAYCAAQGRRLPTEDEWEYAGMASETQRDGLSDLSFRQRLLDLYTRSRVRNARIGSGFTNVYGVSDMHGLVWEWVAPMEMKMAMPTHDLSCAGSASGASDPTNFAAFLRYAYRSGLNDRSTGAGLGFRCAGA